MKKYLILIAIIGIMMLTGCSAKTLQPEAVSETDKEQADYTLLVYMCGSDLETQYGAASENISEMLSAKMGENVNVIVQTGGAKAWRDSQISGNSTDRYLITHGGKELLDRSVVEQNFGDVKCLSDFIEFGITNYPAKHTSLILWNHGGGSVGGICFDSNFSNDSLSLTEIRDALETARNNNVKFNFIGMDACLMATYDTMATLVPYADYFVGSQELEPVNGWNYRTIIENLGEEDLYEKLLLGFEEKQDNKKNYTLSIVDLTHFNDIEKVLADIVNVVKKNYTILAEGIRWSEEFGGGNVYRNNGRYFDMGNMASYMGIDYDWSDCIWTTTGDIHSNSSGVSMFVPIDNAGSIEKYVEICPYPEYAEFLSENFSDKPITTIEYLSQGEIIDNNICFSLKNISKKYVDSVGFEVCNCTTAGGMFYAIGEDNDVIVEDNNYTVNFTGKWVYIGEHLLHTDILDKNDDYTAFAAPVKIDGAEAKLIFNYYADTGECVIEGYIRTDDKASRVYELEEGSEITIQYEKTDKNLDHEMIDEGQIIWSDDACIRVDKLPEGTYQIIPKVTDIYFNTYYANTIFVYYDGNTTEVLSVSSG